MPTKHRFLMPGTVHHVYNRGSQKMRLFRDVHDYARFLNKIIEFQERLPVEILAYCIMPNHFHFVFREPDDDLKSVLREQEGPAKSVTAHFLHLLQNAYAKYFGAKYGFTGRVFQGTYKNKHVTDDGYYDTVVAYIHDNPVRKKLADRPEEWGYSSYAQLCGKMPTLKKGSKIQLLFPTLHEGVTGTDTAKGHKLYAKNRETEYGRIAELVNFR